MVLAILNRQSVLVKLPAGRFRFGSGDVKTSKETYPRRPNSALEQVPLLVLN